MSMQDYETAKNLIEQHEGHADFVGERAEELVSSAEQRLHLRFPPTYRRFLREYGAGGFNSTEIYGIIGAHFEKSGVPDAIWYTLLLRQEDNLPQSYVVIYSVGDGEVFCLDIRDITGTSESPVVTYWPGFPLDEQSTEIVAEDFGAFLLERVQFEIGYNSKERTLLISTPVAW